MAIDTAVKRNSAMNFGVGYTLPLPDGTIGTPDRSTLLRLYSGITLTSAVRIKNAWDYITQSVSALKIRPISETLTIDAGLE